MRFLLSVCLFTFLLSTSAFASYSTASYGGFITYVTNPKLCTEFSTSLPTSEMKSAEGSYSSIFLVPLPLFSQWLFCYGDAGIQNIAKKAGITKIQYVDETTTSVYLFFRWFEQKSYRVYGT